MNIFDALNSLSDFLDMISGTGFLKDWELEKLEEIETVINGYVYEKEKKVYEKVFWRD